MSLLRFPGNAVYGLSPSFAGAAPTITAALLMDVDGEQCAFIFPAPKTGTLHSFDWRLWSSSTNPTNGVRYSFQNVDASGNPDGVADQYRDIPSGFGTGSTWLAPPGPMTDDGTDGGVKRSVTVGDIICCVVSMPSFVAGDCSFTVLDTTGAAGNPLGLMPYSATRNNAGTWTKNANTAVLVLRYDDEYVTIGPDLYPILTVATSTFNSDSTPDEQGVRFTVPVTCYLAGAWVRVDADNAFDVVLYDTDGTTPLATRSFTSGTRISTAGANLLVRFGSVLLTKDLVYRLVVKPTTTSNISIYRYTTGTTTYMGIAPMGATTYYTHRADAGSWTNVDTERVWMGLILDGIESAAAAGGEKATPFLGWMT